MDYHKKLEMTIIKTNIKEDLEIIMTKILGRSQQENCQYHGVATLLRVRGHDAHGHEN